MICFAVPKSAFWSSFSADCSSDNGCPISCPSSQLSSPDEESASVCGVDHFNWAGCWSSSQKCIKFLKIFTCFPSLTTFLHVTFRLSAKTLQCMHSNLALLWGPFIPLIGHFGRNSSVNAGIVRLWVFLFLLYSIFSPNRQQCKCFLFLPRGSPFSDSLDHQDSSTYHRIVLTNCLLNFGR